MWGFPPDDLKKALECLFCIGAVVFGVIYAVCSVLEHIIGYDVLLKKRNVFSVPSSYRAKALACKVPETYIRTFECKCEKSGAISTLCCDLLRKMDVLVVDNDGFHVSEAGMNILIFNIADDFNSHLNFITRHSRVSKK